MGNIMRSSMHSLACLLGACLPQTMPKEGMRDLLHKTETVAFPDKKFCSREFSSDLFTSQSSVSLAALYSRQMLACHHSLLDFLLKLFLQQLFDQTSTSSSKLASPSFLLESSASFQVSGNLPCSTQMAL